MVAPNTNPARPVSKRKGFAASWSRRASARQAPRKKSAARARSKITLVTPRMVRTAGAAKIAPTPSETSAAQKASALHAPRTTVKPAQNPPARQRRAISELIGPGGQATDHPRRKPVASKGKTGASIAERSPAFEIGAIPGQGGRSAPQARRFAERPNRPRNNAAPARKGRGAISV